MIKGYRPDKPKQIVIASRTEQENEILRRKLQCLQQSIKGGVQLQTTRPQAAKLEIAQHPDLVIFNFNEWSREELNSVMQLRSEGFDRMMMILAKSEAPKAVQNLALLDRVVYVEKPYEQKDLVGIAEKALLKGLVAQRVHRRYDTRQGALIEFHGGKSVASQIFNLSKTGAYIELNALQDVDIGEAVQLRMELEDVSRTYLIPAQVIWTNMMGRMGGTGLGVRFTGRGVVRRHIMMAR